MEFSKLNQWLALFANFGVLLGIVFLGVEIQQNTEMLRADMSQNRADSAASIAESVYNSEFMPAILVSVRNGSELDAEDMERYGAWIRSFHRRQDNVYHLYLQGLLPENNLTSIEGAVRITIAESALARSIWQQSSRAFSAEYSDLVDQVISDYLAGTE